MYHVDMYFVQNSRPSHTIAVFWRRKKKLKRTSFKDFFPPKMKERADLSLSPPSSCIPTRAEKRNLNSKEFSLYVCSCDAPIRAGKFNCKRTVPKVNMFFLRKYSNRVFHSIAMNTRGDENFLWKVSFPSPFFCSQETLYSVSPLFHILYTSNKCTIW